MSVHASFRVVFVLLCTAYASIASAQFSYSVYNGTFTTLPDFTLLTPVSTGSTDVIDLSVVSNNPDNIGLVFTNQLTVTTAATYEFHTTSDDGSKLFIDNILVVDNDGLHGAVTVSGEFFLNPGVYSLRVEFFERTGAQVLDVLYRVENGVFGAIPADGQLNGTLQGKSEIGEWSEVIQWPHIAISAANLPDGRILSWSSTETNAFPSNREFTHATLFDPTNNTFQNADSNFHDMFCAGISTLEDGTIVASGGNPDDTRTSQFDPISMTWSPLANMNDRRWYGTNITMPDNQIFSTFAKSAGNRSELYNPDNNSWVRTPNSSMQTLLNEQVAINSASSPSGASTMQWWAHLALAPDGRVFHGGPSETLHLFDPLNSGGNEVLGQLTDGRARMWGNAVTYEAGKVLLVGGSDRRVSPATSTRDVYKVDLLGPTPQVIRAAPMNHARTLSNSVTLPTGEVLVVGGNATGKLFNDALSVFPTEIYNPDTDSWRQTDGISVPRNYHSIALLLKDGRVLSAGGGACGNGCGANHLDGQIFTPPYLFNSDGTSRNRPTILDAPEQIAAGSQIVVSASGDTRRFSVVRLSGTTHHMNTDQRFLSVTSEDIGGGDHTLEFNPNPNILIPGYYWLFALNDDGTPSVGRTIQVVQAESLPDSDGDGVIDTDDAFPNDPTETADSDGDGVGDNADVFPNDPTETTDSDGDGVGDNSDVFPNDPNESADTDDDGIGDNADAFPNDPTETTDNDGDGVGNNADVFPNNPNESADTDGDGIGDNADAFPNDPNESADSDGDGTGDNADAFPDNPDETTDSDGDGVGDNADAFPNDPSESADSDGDGIGDNTDPAPFGDLIVARYVRLTALSEINSKPWASAAEIYLLDADGQSLDRSGWTATASSEETGEFPAPPADVLDGDPASIWHTAWSEFEGSENDLPHPHRLVIDMGTSNSLTALTYQPRANYGNGSIKAYEIHVSSNGTDWGVPVLSGEFSGPGSDTVFFLVTDSDGDGVDDQNDAFPNDPTETTDSDGDGTGDNSDAFPNDPTETTDSDGDGTGDNSDTFPNDPTETADSDGDGTGDNRDAFPNDPTETADSDGDGTGDNRDAFPNDPTETTDSDGDGTGDNRDAFPNDPTETADSDGDGIGDNSDAFPNDPLETTDSDGDGVGDNSDAFPNDPTETTDSDNDGTGDNSDPTPFGEQLSARFVRLTALSEINGNPWATVAELNILGTDGTLLDRSNWTATANSEEVGQSPAPASDALDGDTNTIWHTAWSDIEGRENDLPHPHWIAVDMGVSQGVSGLIYLPRSDYGNGSIQEYQVHISQTGINWTLVAEGVFEGPGADTAFFAVAPPSAVTPLPARPANSGTILVENSSGEDRIWNVNPDNQSVSVSSAGGTLIREITVGSRPWALAARPQAGLIYAVNKGSDSISIIESGTLTVSQNVALPVGSQPHGIVFNSDGSEYFVVLESVAQVQRRNAETHTVIGTAQLGGTPRHIAIKYDDSRLLISNFITTPVPGESTASPDISNATAQVFVVDPASMTLAKTIDLAYDTRAISESSGPGLPNYLNAPVISFDDTLAYVPSKKDNIGAGALRGVPGMTFESTVRANGSRIALDSETEANTIRIDFDNSSLATGAALTGDNRYLLTALETSRELSVFDTVNNFELMRLPTGRAPQGVALSGDGATAYVHNFMDRSISRFDLTEMIETDLPATNVLSAITTVSQETLPATVLAGKQFFYDAADDRLARDNYMSCASCHNDGGGDGRVWDFTSFGEGLRNTISLRGRAGMAHGPLHWSGNFDETQDFEGQIRAFAGGSGLMADTDFNAGTRNQPLGDPKSGVSADLDALSAYLASLTQTEVNPQHALPPSESALRGQVIFDAQNCAACHHYPALTDSGSGPRHNPGTLTPSSGSRLGAVLDGFDTPSLYGLASSAPYLHDGSAATLEAAITAHNTATLESDALQDLANFLRELPQIDANDPSSSARLSTTLVSGVWRQLAVPADTYRLTIEQIFGPVLPLDSYGVSWTLFGFNPQIGAYYSMPIDDTLESGTGYWVIQTSGEDVTISLPTGLNHRAATTTANCPSARGCFAIPLGKRSDPQAVSWNIVGNPFPNIVNGSGLRIVQGNDSYTLTESQNASLTTGQLFVYTGDAGYRSVTESEPLNPWDGGWMALYPQATEGVSLLVPATSPDM